MNWWDFGLGAFSLAAMPAAWVIIFLRRRRSWGLTYHNTTPPTPTVTTGQRR